MKRIFSSLKKKFHSRPLKTKRHKWFHSPNISLQVETLEQRELLFSNGAAKVILGPPVHENITHAALDGILRPEIVTAIIGGWGALQNTGNVGRDITDVIDIKYLDEDYEPSHHFDACNFSESSAFINKLYHSMISLSQDYSTIDSDKAGSLTDLFGQVLHTSQDFYAHSNWVETFPYTFPIPLIDNGLSKSFWDPLTPYSLHSGVYLIEGENPAFKLTPKARYGALVDPTFLVDVQIGNSSPVPGIVSGTYDPKKNNKVPSAVAISHDDPVSEEVYIGPTGPAIRLVPNGTGIAIDRPSNGPNHARAVSAATQQSEVEFFRLLNIVKQNAGITSVEELICRWVKPEKIQSVRSQIGLGSNSTNPDPIRIDTSSPTMIPIGTCIHKSDTVQVKVHLESDDPDDNSEGEPLVIRLGGGTNSQGLNYPPQDIEINTYDQDQELTLSIRLDDEKIFAFIKGADGDEFATVSGVNQSRSSVSNSMNSSPGSGLTDFSSQLNLNSSLFASASYELSGFQSLASPVFATNQNGYQAQLSSQMTDKNLLAVGYNSLAAVQWQLSGVINSLTFSDSDTNYKNLTTTNPVIFSLGLSGTGISSQRSQLISAFNGILSNYGNAINTANLLKSAHQKSRGAKEAGDINASISLDVQARTFSNSLNQLLQQQDSLRAALQVAIQNFGINTSVSTGDVGSFESSLKYNGVLPDTINQILKLSKLSTAEIESIRKLGIVQAKQSVSADLPAGILNANLTTSINNSNTILTKHSQVDLSVGIEYPYSALPNEVYEYNIIIKNNSPLAVNGVTVVSNIDLALENVSWYATTIGISGSGPTRSGNINEQQSVSIPANGSIYFTVTAKAKSVLPPSLDLTAQAIVPANTVDPTPANNIASIKAKTGTYSLPVIDPIQDISINSSGLPVDVLIPVKDDDTDISKLTCLVSWDKKNFISDGNITIKTIGQQLFLTITPNAFVNDETKITIAITDGSPYYAKRVFNVSASIHNNSTIEFSESNPNDWAGFPENEATIEIDTQHVISGNSAIKFKTTGGFDTGVRFPKSNDAHWNLSRKFALDFWVYSDNTTPYGYQGNQPVIVLNSPTGQFTYTPAIQLMPKTGWGHFTIPLTGDYLWKKSISGNANLNDVTSLEIHQDTWDYGFTVYYDGVQFISSNYDSPELTENSFIFWDAFASDNAKTTLNYDTSKVKLGAKSIHLRTESGFDTGVKFPKTSDAHWNLSGNQFVEFWAYSDNQSTYGFQGNQPVIVLNAVGGKVILTPVAQMMSKTGWNYFSIPINGNAVWNRTITGSPDLKDVNSIEIHQDTWDYGFDIYYDGLRFTGQQNPPSLGVIGNKAVQGGQLIQFNVNAFDPDTPSNKLSYSILSAPSGAIIDSATGLFSWLTTSAMPGDYSLKIRVSDTTNPNLFDEQPVNITVLSSGPKVTWAGYIYLKKSPKYSFFGIVFSEALDATSAGNINGYQLIDLGKDRRAGTRDDKKLKFSVSYYEASDGSKNVFLTPSLALSTSAIYMLIIDGTSTRAIKNKYSQALDGNNDGKAGGNYVRTIVNRKLR